MPATGVERADAHSHSQPMTRSSTVVAPRGLAARRPAMAQGRTVTRHCRERTPRHRPATTGGGALAGSFRLTHGVARTARQLTPLLRCPADAQDHHLLEKVSAKRQAPRHRR